MSSLNDRTNSLLEDLQDDKEEVDSGKIKDNPKKECIDHQKAKYLLNFEDAPEYIKHNPYILTGYRGILNTDMCIQR